jgi:hypothetical protein
VQIVRTLGARSSRCKRGIRKCCTGLRLTCHYPNFVSDATPRSGPVFEVQQPHSAIHSKGKHT